MDFSRRKSCIQCRRAKTRCNLDSSTCSRCRKKRLQCNYEHRTAPSTSPSVQNNMFHSWLASTNAAGGSAPVDINQNELPCESRDSEYLELPVLFDAVFDELSAPLPMEWSTRQGIPEAGLANATEGPTRSAPGHSTDGESMFWIEYQPSPLANDSISAPPQHNSVSAKKGDVSSLSSAMKNTSKLLLASWQALRDTIGDLPTLLNRKKPTTMLSLTIGNFIWATIESYAIQLGRRSLPPFIHRSSCASEIGDRCLDFDKLPEPLANCYNIIPLYMQKTPITQPLAFKTLILEIQRLYDEVRILLSAKVKQMLTLFSSKRTTSKLCYPPCKF
jgi:Fungal Zn(2)-Cys(6) binuclear cluster domain